MIKSFVCDGNVVCAVCYLDVLNKTEYPDLVLMNTKTKSVKNDTQCEWCSRIVSDMECLKSASKILTKIEGL